MNKLRIIFATLLTTAGIVGVQLLVPEFVGAQAANQILNGAEQASGEDRASADIDTTFRDVVNFLLYLIGAIAVIMLIFGGFRYVTSGGDGSAITSAKNTILYAVIGLAVAIIAYAIVNFVITALNPPTTTTSTPPRQNGPIQITD